MNYNMNPSDVIPQQRIVSYAPNCNLCRGTGNYNANGIMQRCTCGDYMASSNYNYPVLSTEYNPQLHHPHHRNIFSRSYEAVKDCVMCAGRGFQNSWTKSGHPKVCYECIRKNKYCPICNNTGIKLHSNQKCKCGLY